MRFRHLRETCHQFALVTVKSLGAQVMQEVLMPAFRKSEYERGVREALKVLTARARDKKVPRGFIRGCGPDAH